MHEVYNYQNGMLYVEQVKLEEIARQVGTPVFVYSDRALRDNWQAAQKALAEIDPVICFAVKSNTSKAVMATFASMGAGADIVSGGELTRALQANIPANKIVFSGVGKTAKEIELALRASILMLNVESPAELDMVNDVAGRLKLKAPVAFRVNPDVDAKTHPKITTGLMTNKFGLTIEDAFVQYKRAASMENIELKGISCHIGSQLTEVAPFADAAKRVAALVERLNSEGIKLEYFDLGGGLGIVYNDETPPTWQEYARVVVPVVKALNMRLVLEPGRSMVGNAGLLLTQVVLTKETPLKKFVVVDAAMNDLMRPAMYDAFHDIKPLTMNFDQAMQKVDVVGSICETGDYLARDRELLPQKSGDFLAVMSAGAYGFSMSSTYNSRVQAAEVMVKGQNFEVIRPRQQLEELNCSELLPSWLSEGIANPLQLAGLRFTKMSGAGNDFIMLDNRVYKLPLDVLKTLAERLCPRAVAVGADGLIALREYDGPDSAIDFAWDFFNSDGSMAEMCGNGARCAARFANKIGLAGDSMVFETVAGPIRAWINGEEVKVGLTPPKDMYFEVKLSAEGNSFTVMGANTGVPHAVVMCDNLETAPVDEWGRALRYHEHFAPAGTNVNFANLVDDMLSLRTYERGVEGETLACGTGSVAAALTVASRNNLPSPVKVQVKSGAVLKVYFSKDAKGHFQDVMLEGPAKYVYSASLQADILR